MRDGLHDACDACHSNNNNLLSVLLLRRSPSIQLVQFCVRFIGATCLLENWASKRALDHSSNTINNGQQIDWHNKKRPTIRPFAAITSICAKLGKGSEHISFNLSSKILPWIERHGDLFVHRTLNNRSHICCEVAIKWSHRFGMFGSVTIYGAYIMANGCEEQIADCRQSKEINVSILSWK